MTKSRPANLMRRMLAYSLYLVAIGAPIALAGDVELPHIFRNGTVADARQVNETFASIASGVNDNHSRLASLEQAPAFQAETRDLEISGLFDTLVLEYERLDEGDGYDPTTGVYTVPRDGVYQLNFKTTIRDNGLIKMVRNEEEIAEVSSASVSLPGPGNNPTGTTSVLARLAAGDRISLQLQHSIGPGGFTSVTVIGYSGAPVTIFSGHWIRP